MKDDDDTVENHDNPRYESNHPPLSTVRVSLCRGKEAIQYKCITLVNPLCPINDQVLFSLKNLTPGLNTQFKRKDNKSVK